MYTNSSCLDNINKMGKSKSAKSAQAAQPVATKEVKQISAVQNGATTKSSQSSKVKSMEAAKEVATKANGSSKKTKKVIKEPSPEDSDMSDASSKEESDEDESSASSASSDDESDEEPAPKLNGAKPTGAGDVLEADSSDSSESSEDEDEADVKPVGLKQNGQATAGKKVKAGSDIDSDDDSEDASEDESGEDAKPKGAVAPKAVNGKQGKAAAKKVSKVLLAPSRDIELTKSRHPPTWTILMLLHLLLPPTPSLTLTRRAKKRHQHLRSARLRRYLRLPRKRSRVTHLSPTKSRGICLWVSCLGTLMKSGSNANLKNSVKLRACPSSMTSNPVAPKGECLDAVPLH